MQKKPPVYICILLCTNTSNQIHTSSLFDSLPFSFYCFPEYFEYLNQIIKSTGQEIFLMKKICYLVNQITFVVVKFMFRCFSESNLDFKKGCQNKRVLMYPQKIQSLIQGPYCSLTTYSLSNAVFYNILVARHKAEV